MKEQKHYIQVWIESEDDLPEVDGKYIVHNKNNGNIVRYHWYCNDNCASFWIQRVDWYFAEWYLISTKQPKGLTDEEIEKKHPTKIANIEKMFKMPKNYTKSVYDNLLSIAERHRQYQVVCKWARDQMQGNRREERCGTCGMLMDIKSEPEYICMNPDCENYCKTNK